MNVAPWHPLDEALDMAAAVANVCSVDPLAGTEIDWPVWSVNVTPVVRAAGVRPASGGDGAVARSRP